MDRGEEDEEGEDDIDFFVDLPLCLREVRFGVLGVANSMASSSAACTEGLRCLLSWRSVRGVLGHGVDGRLRDLATVFFNDDGVCGKASVDARF